MCFIVALFAKYLNMSLSEVLDLSYDQILLLQKGLNAVLKAENGNESNESNDIDTANSNSNSNPSFSNAKRTPNPIKSKVISNDMYKQTLDERAKEFKKVGKTKLNSKELWKLLSPIQQKE
jgi:hypothetical protein